MECYHLLSLDKFLSPSNRFLRSRFSREAVHGLARKTIPNLFIFLPFFLPFRKKFHSIGAESSSEKLPRKSPRMVPRETYRFTSKPFDMYARRRPLVSELFTGVSRIGTRRVIRLTRSRERDTAKIVTSRPRRIPCDFNSTDTTPPRRSRRRVVALTPHLPSRTGTARVPCPTHVDNVSLAGDGTIRRRVTHHRKLS